MKQHLPNLLTLLRFPLALGLLPMRTLSPAFLVLYLLCGVTDVLDGALARRWSVCSDAGARLDSAADLLLAAVLVFKLWPALALDAPLIACAAGVALCRFAAALTAKLRFGRFGFLHTYANKAAGVLLALVPFVLALSPARWPLVVLLLVTGISALEELLIELTALRWSPNQTSILQRSK